MITISSAADIQAYVYDSHPDFTSPLDGELVLAIQNADHPRYGTDWAEWLEANMPGLREAIVDADEDYDHIVRDATVRDIADAILGR
jgi:hypothetical protein